MVSMLVCLGALAFGASMAPARGSVRLLHVARFHFPTYVANTPADPHAIYVVERTGRVYIVRGGHLVHRPFLDLHTQIRIATNSEQGLLSLAFAPNYARSRLYYVYYSNRQGNIRLVQFQSAAGDPNRTLPGSGRVILAIHHPAINHYGGQLQFGADRDLYVSIGDGGCCGDPHNHAQTLNNLFGKILRISPQRGGRHAYLIPRGNPFAHRRGARPEIFAYGFRNPFRFSFDSSTGAAWIGDVGQDRFEEIDYEARGHLAGKNFGWSRFEGFSQYSNRAAPGAVKPVIVEAHSGPAGTHENWCAIIGGFVERDRTTPSVYGRYLFGDHCTGRIFSARISAHGHVFAVGPTGLVVPALLTSFGTDAAHRVYVVSENGWVYRVAAR